MEGTKVGELCKRGMLFGPRGWNLSCRRVTWARWLSWGVFFSFSLFFSLACHAEPTRPPGQATPRFIGFSVFGPDWPVKEVFADETERLAYLEKQGYLIARHTSELHGNIVRVPISVWGVLGQNLPLDTELIRKPLYQADKTVVAKSLEKITAFLQASLDGMAKDHNANGQPLHWHRWDAFLAGIQQYNTELAASPAKTYPAVWVNLFLTIHPPVPIIEEPRDKLSGGSFAALFGRDVWGQYRELHIRFVRKLVQRYGRGYGQAGTPAVRPLAAAIEMFNEPDYGWLPDELKIEKALNPDAYPCHKYITQLHLSQVPENDLPGKACILKDGFYREQPLPVPAVETPLRDFRWGLKFDLYVEFFADLHEHVSFAAKDEIQRGRADMVVVSSAVTHVNIDWFIRMFRANPETFRYVDKIGIHPYHWPQHDIHDMTFVDTQMRKDWASVNPRVFARDYFKRFDFIRELTALVAEPDWEKSYGLSGKALWVTEFGIPTKKLGKANAAIPKHWKIFIYDRASDIPDGMAAIRWEDKWEAFFDQVTADFLHTNHIEAFMIYTLRESLENETNDENHSNFSLYTADWSCRLAPPTLTRMADFFQNFRGGKAN